MDWKVLLAVFGAGFLVVVIAVLGIAFLLFKPPVEEAGSLRFTVVTSSQPLAGASVTVYDSNKTVIREGTTDSEGIALFNLPKGTYSVEISSPGHGPEERGISILGSGEQKFTVKMSSGVSCQEDWDCTDWSDCVGDNQSRSCTDSNNCGTTVNKPDEAKSCTASLPSSCVDDPDCDDGDDCTLDKCADGNCSNTEITSCEDNDGCCPPTCTHATDSDCPEIPIPHSSGCDGDSDCDDGDPCTEDSCSSSSCTNLEVPNNTPCGENKICCYGFCSEPQCYTDDECMERAPPGQTLQLYCLEAGTCKARCLHTCLSEDGDSCPDCSCSPPCCGECDEVTEQCFHCLINDPEPYSWSKDSVDGNCEEQCGASYYCDEIAPAGTTEDSGCCGIDCSIDWGIDDDEFNCHYEETCLEGYLKDGDECYWGVTCTEEGWEDDPSSPDTYPCSPFSSTNACVDGGTCYYNFACALTGLSFEMCPMESASCGQTELVPSLCGNEGCNPDSYVCSGESGEECNPSGRYCDVDNYKCRYSNEGEWEWTTSLGTETACDDTHDNDCDGDLNCADSDCDGDPACS